MNVVCYVLELTGIHQEEQDLNFFRVEAAYLACRALLIATKAHGASKSHSSLLSPRKIYWVFVKIKCIFLVCTPVKEQQRLDWWSCLKTELLFYTRAD